MPATTKLTDRTSAKRLAELCADFNRRRLNIVNEVAESAFVAWEGGKILLAEREKHNGAWMNWLAENFPLTPRTAQLWMSLAFKYETVSQLRARIEMGPKLLRYIELIEDEPREPRADHELPTWSRLTMKIDATIPKLSGDDRAKFREWWLSIGQRMGFSP